uniref:Uncharacterized protein n=1 Tax=Panagrolaimus sp. ES5 TaxID=591445 RepID=A0AC34GY79_9BILA
MGLIFITTIFLSFLNIFGNGTPMKCTRISSTDIFDEYDYGNITGSAVLSVYKRNNTQYISIMDVDVVNYKDNLTAIEYCIGKAMCTNNMTSSFEIPFGNESFAIDAYFSSPPGFEFFHGVVDDEGFFAADGTMYSFDNLCTTAIANQSNLIVKETHCCLAFSSVPEAPPNSRRCKKFQSRSSILNVDDNYSIFATTNMTFILNGNNLTAFGTFNGPNTYAINIFLNGNYWMCSSDPGAKNVSCYPFTFPNGDSKSLVVIEFINWEGNVGYGSGGMISRILIRDGQTLMEEGVPYTSKNNCMYLNFPYEGNSNQIVNNQFCCTEFENASHEEQQQQIDISIPFQSLSNPPSLPQGFVKHSKYGHDNLIKHRLSPKAAV